MNLSGFPGGAFQTESSGVCIRRRATHNRLFDSLTDLEGSLRNSLCHFQPMRGRVKTLLNGRKKRLANRTAS
jgi:hypothetical protein